MKFYNEQPNTTLVLNSPCNARCKFCFWTKNEVCDRTKYLNRIKSVMRMLPDECTQISISGGEPTFDLELLWEVLEIINLHKETGKIKKVVMTTNGFRLEEFLNKNDSNITIIDHINISRHSHDQEENYEIFKTDSVPSDIRLEKTIEGLERVGIDCSMNYVYDDNTNPLILPDIISFAKRMGFVRLHMRYNLKHGISRQSEIQNRFSHLKTQRASSCPVCKNVEQRIKGYDVVWKYGELETFDKVGDDTIYEVIVQSDGLPTSDWAGNNCIIMELPHLKYKRQSTVKVAHSPTISYYSGCGGGRSYGGC